jgi:Arc/MetJ-type ribon-helix-helix transcriptional regulator
MEVMVRLDRAVEDVVERLVDYGYFKTRTEAIRAGLLGLGKEYGVLPTPQELEDELAVRKMQKIDGEIRSGKVKPIPLEEYLKHGKAGRRKRG